MNHTPSPLQSSDADEREWSAQERALHEERIGAPMSEDPLLAAYRDVARALRAPLPDGLPADFAATVAARCRAEHARARVDTRLEQQVQRLLLATLAVAAIAVVALYGGQWLRASADALPLFDSSVARNWLGALAACLALSWAMGVLRARIPGRD